MKWMYTRKSVRILVWCEILHSLENGTPGCLVRYRESSFYLQCQYHCPVAIQTTHMAKPLKNRTYVGYIHTRPVVLSGVHPKISWASECD